MRRLLTLCILLVASVVTASAELSMPSIFGDKMVLQQCSDVKLWGKADPMASIDVRVSWSKAKYRAQADESGRWSLKVATPSADKLHHTVVVKSGKETLSFDKVLLGEVWLCAGQSNMVMYLSRSWGQCITAGESALMLAPNDNIRLYQAERTAELEPKCDVKGEWSEANATVLESFSSTAYFFARNLQAALDVPVAVIVTAWGGSLVSAFMSEEAIAGFDDLSSPTSVDPADAPGGRVHHLTSVIYNGMINPVLGYGIKGMLWYQGESDKQIYKIYPARFEAMVNDLREKWGVGDFSVHITEIAPYDYPGGSNAALMREAQAKPTETLENCYIISLFGLGMKGDIHPPQKDVVGNRFARNVLDKSYGWEMIKSTLSRPTKYEYVDGKVLVSLTPNGFPDRREAIEGFEVAGEDRVFHKATAYMKSPNHRLEVSSPEVENPVAVRYQFKGWVEPSEVIYDSRGNPLPSFRSDDWEEEVDQK